MNSFMVARYLSVSPRQAVAVPPMTHFAPIVSGSPPMNAIRLLLTFNVLTVNLGDAASRAALALAKPSAGYGVGGRALDGR